MTLTQCQNICTVWVALGLDNRITLRFDDVFDLGSSYGSFDCSNDGNQWVHCLVFQLDKMFELIWVLLMVLLVVIQMAWLRDKHWQYHFNLLMVKHLAWMKALYQNLLLVKWLALHLNLMMELTLIFLLAPFMVPMMANLWVNCLDKRMEVS